MKRFYKEVTVTDECGLLLDGRPVRTPAPIVERLGAAFRHAAFG